MKTNTTAAAALTPSATATHGVGVLAYGLACYALGMGGLFWLVLSSLGLIAFTGGPVSFESTSAAIAFNLAFILLFGVQHAIMARPAFKQRWTKTIHPAAERSTFVVLAGGIMALTMWLWQPMTSTIWSVENATLAGIVRGVGALGWVYMVAASFAIDHFELFGLKQVWRNFRGGEQRDLPMVSRLMYRFDRHPLMTGILLGLWAQPNMTLDRLVLALGFTSYIVAGVLIEERTLVELHGEGYRAYRRRVGALVPLPGKGK